MSYAQIHITVKQPSRKMEAVIKEMGVKKNDRQKDLRAGREEGEKIQVK